MSRFDKIVDATDEWFHRHGFGLVQAEGKKATVYPWWGHIVRPLCELRERRNLGRISYAQMVDDYTATTGNITTGTMKVLRWNASHNRRSR